MSEEAENIVHGDNNKNVDSLDRLLDMLNHPVKRILPLLYNGSRNGDVSSSSSINRNIVVADERNQSLQDLIDISKSLFADIEVLATQYREISSKSRNITSNSTTKSNESLSASASGLGSLFVPPSIEPSDTDLPETIYGQVELQNEAVLKLVKKGTHRLSKSTKDICVLDMRVTASSEDDDNDSNGDDDDNRDDSDNDSDNYEQEGSIGADCGVENDINGSEDDDDEDEDTKRIRNRMKLAMEDMSEDEQSVSGVEKTTGTSEPSQKDSKQDEELYDPVAEAMKDGFFDLNEMEEFADEEEEYLPDESLAQAESGTNPKKTKKEVKKSFHQRQREGDLGSDSNSDDDDGLDDIYEEVKPTKRKKYRDQEDINALYDLYQEPNIDDDDDDVVNMTAAKFFGAPKKTYLERYKKGQLENKEVGDRRGAGKLDDDSWGEYDFEKEDRSGWRDESSVEHPDENYDDIDGDDKAATIVGRLEEDGGIAAAKKGAAIGDRKLQRLTAEMENELLAEKPWRMSGETRSSLRPVNSLLEGTPEFEMASKQAPTITVEHTIDLEEAIKKRILAEDWDDVVPRELPDVGWHKKRGELPAVSQEKSKLGLGELYEREYMKRAVGYDVDAAEKKTEEDKAKDEMKQLFANLCSRLDALSNYNFAPRPIADEAEVRPVTAPAIAMEEVLPLHVSDARAVAPEEIYATKRGRDGILRQETEIDQGDRKRLRQSKKAARRKVRQAKLADDKLISRLEPGLGLNNPYEKRKAREELATARSRGKVTTGEHDQDSKFGSSGTFFKRLQNEAQQAIHGAAEPSVEGAEMKTKAKSSAFKL